MSALAELSNDLAEFEAICAELSSTVATRSVAAVGVCLNLAENCAENMKGMLDGLGNMGWFSIVATAAAVAVVAIAARRFWRPQEPVKYILLGGGKASTELASRLPEAEVVSVRRFTGDCATAATMKEGLASIRKSFGPQRCVMVLFAAEADPVRFQDSATQFAAEHGCRPLADEEAYAFLAPSANPSAPLNPMLRLNVMLPFALAELAAEDPSITAVCVSTSYVFDPKVAMPAGRILKPTSGVSMSPGSHSVGHPVTGHRGLLKPFYDFLDGGYPVLLGDNDMKHTEDMKHTKVDRHTGWQDMKADLGIEPGSLQDTADNFLAALRKGLENGASFFPDHFLPKAQGGGGVGGYQLSKYLSELAFDWRRHFSNADDRLVVIRYPTLVGAGPLESPFGGGKYYLQARKEIVAKERGKTPTCREKARNMLTYKRAADYTAQVLKRLPDRNFRYVNVAGPYAFSDKDYHVAVRYGLYATYASSLDDPDVQAGAPVVLAQIRELLSVVLAQIRELLAEDTEACPYPNITDVYATAAAAPLATKDNTIMAVDPTHFTPADPREVVAEFYEAIADWAASGRGVNLIRSAEVGKWIKLLAEMKIPQK